MKEWSLTSPMMAPPIVPRVKFCSTLLAKAWGIGVVPGDSALDQIPRRNHVALYGEHARSISKTHDERRGGIYVYIYICVGHIFRLVCTPEFEEARLQKWHGFQESRLALRRFVRRFPIRVC